MTESAIEKSRKHFADKLTGELQKIHVAEWDMDVYYKTINSFAIESKIIELTQKGKITEALIETLIQKALDKNGKPFFTKYDKTTFINEVDPTVITRVVTQINATDVVDFEAVSKN